MAILARLSFLEILVPGLVLLLLRAYYVLGGNRPGL
jgi:hypothetical protein